MQLTMNSNELSVSNKANLLSWLSKAAKKMTAIFTKKEIPPVDKELSEAIRAIEWRTRYNQQRIVRYIYTASFQKDNPRLYETLNMSLPIKHFWTDEKVSIEITDNTFERKLVRFFGDLNPTTKQLIDGIATKHQRWVKKNARITELYLNRYPIHGIPKLNGYEQQILQVLKEQNAIVRIPTIATCTEVQAKALMTHADQMRYEAYERKLVRHLTASPSGASFKESPDYASLKHNWEQLNLRNAQVAQIDEVVEVVAETLPIEETVVLNTTPLTDAELAKLRQAMAGKTSINKLLLPDLKLYAKAHRIHIPGSAKKIRAIKEIVITAQRGSTKFIEI